MPEDQHVNFVNYIWNYRICASNNLPESCKHYKLVDMKKVVH